MRIDRGQIIAYAVGWLIGMALLLVIVGALNVAADGDTSPPECPPGLVCELPTNTPAPTRTPPVDVTSEPYPPPEPQPTPEPYPYPAGHARPVLGERVYLSPVMGDSSP